MDMLPLDEIRVEDLEVFANHGVFQEENRLGQKFLISLTMYVDGQAVCSCQDTMYTHGAAGYVVDEGAIVAETFTVTGL